MRFNAEIMEAGWFATDELPRPLWPFTEKAIALGLDLQRMISAQATDGLPVRKIASGALAK
jgi:hypothetical protein